ncbi:MAG: DEAD/DEAH box helicase [Spirochaetes bacterium]|nr:DEAD/DEAH box helicase [Spirochaetota bacterium]
MVTMYGRKLSQAFTEGKPTVQVGDLSPCFRRFIATHPAFSPDRKKDVIILADPGLCRFLLFVPQLIHVLSSQRDAMGLILTSQTPDVKDIEDFIRLQRPISYHWEGQSVLGLGTTHALPYEERILSTFQGILVSTSDRLIDHLRRGTFPTNRLTHLVIDCSATCNVESFVPDVEFILSKLEKPIPTVVVSELPLDTISSLIPLLRKVRIIPRIEGFPVQCVEIPPRVKKETVLAGLLAKDKSLRNLSIVFIDGNESLLRLTEELRTEGINPEEVNIQLKIEAREMPHQAYRVFLFESTPSWEDFTAACKILSSMYQGKSYVILLIEQEKETLFQLQERAKVAMEIIKQPVQEDSLRKLIERFLQEIRSSEDPKELTYFKKFISKHVSIFLRSYFAAYLLKLLYQATVEGTPLGMKNSDKVPMTTLFFSMGKNRKIFPRDLSALICGLPNFSKADIGEIKILDNYSFVEVTADKAQKLIEQLNGVDFKGKKLTVNYARKKEDKSEPSTNHQSEDSKSDE